MDHDPEFCIRCFRAFLPHEQTVRDVTGFHDWECPAEARPVDLAPRKSIEVLLASSVFDAPEFFTLDGQRFLVGSLDGLRALLRDLSSVKEIAA